jgi:hypothetical protein
MTFLKRVYYRKLSILLIYGKFLKIGGGLDNDVLRVVVIHSNRWHRVCPAARGQ